ncbi:MAG TPA: hypothetical protein VEO19_06650 [Terriglobia bacterium]|nr:hypothetical protein [Terriglobia bacterium]
MSEVRRRTRGNRAERVVLGLGLGMSLVAASCGWTPSSKGIVLTVTPATAYVPVSSSLQFGVSVVGTPNALVVWSAGGIVGGSSTVGFISSTGFYRAPASVPSPNQVTITATSQYDGVSSSSATVTIVNQSSSAHTVQVASGQTISNVNVEVSPLTPTLSIYGAGTCNGSSCSTAATGAQVVQGGSATLFIVGNGIVPGTVYSISGKPTDVTVTQPSGAQFGQTNNGTPSVSFDIAVSATAVPGLRNIMVLNPGTGELSVFVGGLLIVSSGQ